MGINFIGETGVYLPTRDAIKIVALDGERVIYCYVTRSALDAIGCPDDDEGELLRHFERERGAIEIAAIAKYRRALAPTVEINIEAADLATVLPAAVA